MNEIILDLNSLKDIAFKINNHFKLGGKYIIVKNTNITNLDNIISFYNELNHLIGKTIPIDLEENTYNPTNKYWTDVKYDYSSDQKQFWRSSNHQNLHTDNSFAENKFYANLTELLCIKPVEFSGHTTIIDNEKVVELIKYLDKNTNNNLFEKIYNREIYFSINSDFQIKKKILTYDENKQKYIFNFNYYPASRANNTDENKKIIEELHLFLEEKIMNSYGLMDEIKLNFGDIIIFNDELVLHGRRSFIGTRHYKKCGLKSFSLIDSDLLICEKK
jgi:alpha-ketoglutarate-dependent taurine dioxygenase